MTTIRFFCTRWGAAGTDWYKWAAQVRAAGYEGVETDVPVARPELRTMLDALKTEGLQWVGQHWQTMDADFSTHKAAYREHLEDLIAAGPLHINSHTGRDWFSLEQNEELINLATELSAQSGIAIYHETHRGRFAFAAHVAADYMQRLPDLRFTLDISHWVTVAEFWLEDQSATITEVIERTRHVHARVGYTQGPQIADPRSPVYAEAVAKHLNWWDRVVAAAVKNERKELIFVPEFGPAPYMPSHPKDGSALADQWNINCYMMDLLKKRYNQTFLNTIS